MKNSLDKETIKSFEKFVREDRSTNSARNASFRNDLLEISMDWDHYRKIDHSFSHVVTGEMPTTNQKSSGRCWGFAGLNLFRIYLGRKYNLTYAVRQYRLDRMRNPIVLGYEDWYLGTVNNENHFYGGNNNEAQALYYKNI